MTKNKVKNSEPLGKWLNRNNAIYQWGIVEHHSGRRIESYVVRGGGRVLLEIYEGGNGWEIWSNDGSNDIELSLADAERRAVHGNAPKGESGREWRARLMRETEGLTKPKDIVAALKADTMHNGPPPKANEGDRPHIYHRDELLWQLGQGLRSHEGMGYDRKLSDIEVRWLKDDQVVKRTSVAVALDYLVNDIYYDEAADWSGCDALHVEVAGSCP